MLCEKGTIVLILSGKFESSINNAVYTAEGANNLVGSLDIGADRVAGIAPFSSLWLSLSLPIYLLYLSIYLSLLPHILSRPSFSTSLSTAYLSGSAAIFFLSHLLSHSLPFFAYYFGLFDRLYCRCIELCLRGRLSRSDLAGEGRRSVEKE